MKSKITIEVDFTKGVPFIKVVHERTSTDLKDKAVRAFFEMLNDGSWAEIKFLGHGSNPSGESYDRWGIYPVPKGQETFIPTK